MANLWPFTGWITSTLAMFFIRSSTSSVWQRKKWLLSNKLASPEATLIRNYDPTNIKHIDHFGAGVIENRIIMAVLGSKRPLMRSTRGMDNQPKSGQRLGRRAPKHFSSSYLFFKCDIEHEHALRVKFLTQTTFHLLPITIPGIWSSNQTSWAN